MTEYVKRFLSKFKRSTRKAGDFDIQAQKICSINGGDSDSKLRRDVGESCYQEEYETKYYPSYRPMPNIATCLITLFIIIIFAVLPVIYLLHSFQLLNGTWPKEHKPEHYVNHNNLFLIPSRHSDVNRIKVGLDEKPKTVQPTSSVLPDPSPPTTQQCSNIDDQKRFDCYPQNGVDEDKCKARGCCWSPVNSYTIDVPLDVPYCFYPTNYGGYSWVNASKTMTGISAFMRRTFKSFYPDDIELIRVDVKFESQKRIRIKITDALQTRYEPPYPEVPVVETAAIETDYRFDIDQKTTGFKVVRKSNNQSIFDTQDVGGMIFANQFLQISSLLSTDYIYGLGEHTSTFLLSTHWQRFTMWNHDSMPQENTNLYGSHPFYVGIEKSGMSHGVFLLNSNAMDIILQPTPAITFRTIGGIVDFYIFLGPTPSDVAKQYTEVVGTPYMPPFWALGFHLCRFGYKSLNKTKEVWKRTRDFGIPLDVQWNDLDYMDNSNDFTYDKVNFKGLPAFVGELHDLGMKYTVLIDPGISSGEKRGAYPPYDEGVKLGIFVKNETDMPFEGKVWNNVSTVWPDFTNPHTVDYWIKQLSNMHKEFEFDGAWIDMNEPSNFYSGTKHGCANNKLEHPPYLPYVDGGVLYYKSLCMSSKQYAGIHYDVHNLYGFTEAIVTSFAMSELRSRRPFVISRSTFPGHGHYAGHWTGDVRSSWFDMRKSIPQILNVNVFGIPLVGADICGFNGNTTVDLCNRWSQLGAFYPFSRNHNTDDGIEQDPVALGKDVAISARDSLLIRYSLLPYLYTLFYEAHKDGTLVARSLAFEFYQDQETYIIDDQFLWGPGLMIVPVLEPDQLEVNPYLPNGVWYDFYTFGQIPASGSRHTIQAPLHRIPLLLRGGHVIPMQKPEVTTAESRKNPIELLVSPDEHSQATGSLFWDDGDTLNTVGDQMYNLLNFTLSKSVLTGVAEWWGYDVPLVLGQVTVLGVGTAVKTVYVNEAAVPFSYDTINKFLRVEHLVISLKQPFTVRWV